ncbi:MFS transporter [Amycolatopsis ultiminotia]|uniref:MFS transporter n=1 Tax=Amycolatopsis ultiminotia TaxID=543629 RepID=A0ABP6YCL1_9PSEU
MPAGSDDAADGPATGTPMRRVVIASFLGATFEWFDFGLYGTSAAIVFNKEFFPTMTPLVGTLLAFATAAVGYLARPIGGLVFGHFGDRLGRKSMLTTTMLIMGVSTVLIGALPTYHAIGVTATILLVALRVLQGIGLGGEYAGAALNTLESAPQARRGFFGSLPQVGNPAGGLLATLLVAACATLPEDQYLGWGWRVPFLLSSILLVLGLYFRLRLSEPKEFAEVRRAGKQAKVPVVELLRTCPRNFFLALGSRTVDAVAGNVFGGLAIAYGVTVIGVDRDVVLFASAAAAAVEIAYVPFIGRLANRVSRKRIYLIGVALIAAMSYPFFVGIGTGNAVVICVVMIAGLSLASGTEFAVQSTLLAEVFPVHLRYTAISLVYQLTATVGGLSNLAAVSILIGMDGSPWLVAGLLVAVAALGFWCTAKLRPATAPALRPHTGDELPATTR